MFNSVLFIFDLTDGILNSSSKATIIKLLLFLIPIEIRNAPDTRI
jgi:hypothetical protein